MDTLQNVNIAISTSDAIKVSQASIVLDTLAGNILQLNLMLQNMY